jgi:branched-chain amino acid aminotransferase
MADKMFVNLNGAIVPAADAPASELDTFRLRYGLYETYLVQEGAIEYEHLHWQRLFKGLNVLGFDISRGFTEEYLHQQLQSTVRANKLSALSRLRLQIFTDDKELPLALQFLVEVFPLNPSMTQWITNGIKVAVLSDFVKLIEESATLKISHNLHFLPARKALQKGVADDMLLLNEEGNIIESAIANIFIYRDGTFFTPPLSEGCLAGTIRQVILMGMKRHRIAVKEVPLSKQDLYDAEEIFLCNGIRKIRWVREFEGKLYGHGQTLALYRLLFFPNN